MKLPLLAWAAWQLQFSPAACGTSRKHVTKPFPQPAAPDCRTLRLRERCGNNNDDETMLLLKKKPRAQTDSPRMFIERGGDDSDTCDAVAMAMAADLLHFSISTLDIAPLVQTASSVAVLEELKKYRTHRATLLA